MTTETTRVSKNAARYAWKQVPMLDEEHLVILEALAFKLFSSIKPGGVKPAEQELLKVARGLQQKVIEQLRSVP